MTKPESRSRLGLDVNLCSFGCGCPSISFNFWGKNRLSSPRVGPLGGTNDNQDTLGVGTRSPVGYQILVSGVQSQREKIGLLDRILGVSRLTVFKKRPIVEVTNFGGIFF